LSVRTRVRLLTVLAVLALAPAAAGAAPRVTVISDSVGGVLSQPEAQRILSPGLDVHVDWIVCRKLVDPGCGGGPPSALATVEALGPAVGSIVVVDVGYNDAPSVYAPGIELVLRALAAAREKQRGAPAAV
jgi:hypothetical protein